MGRIFGTDGVRGVANVDVTPELALALGRAVVTVLHEQGQPRPGILVGRDPRWSGEPLEAALVAGITSAGGDAIIVGVLPTPGVAYLTASSDLCAGIVISASHNPVEDNGLKVFGPDGFKLSDDEEDRLEQLLEEPDGPRPVGTALGRIVPDRSAVSRYVEHLAAAADDDLGGMKVVVDAANGAASHIAPLVYRRLGASVVALHCSPDGANINDGVGSTYPQVVAEAVRDGGAAVGLSHDGDADRLIAAAPDGTIIDGDVTLAILARARRDAGTLKADTVVTTVMTNLGFKRAMQGLGIGVVETKVGDRYVLEAMRERDLVLGGEQSGHVIQLDEATTGDGILTAVKLLSVVRSSGESLNELAKVMTRLPQVLVNVRVQRKDDLEGATEVWRAIEREEEALGEDGRVLVRTSGTEPLVRVMVEAPTDAAADEAANRIAAVVADVLGTA